MRCSICGAQIKRVKSATGRMIEVDPVQCGYWNNYYGEDVIIRSDGVTQLCSYSTNPYRTKTYGYVPHWKNKIGAVYESKEKQMNYREFLESKIEVAPDSGFHIDQSEINQY